MTPQPHVLVPIDGSAAAQRAVGHAAALADRLGARLSFAHVQRPSGSIVELEATDAESSTMMAAIAAAHPQLEARTSIIVADDIACAICDSFPDAIVVAGSEHAAQHAAVPSIAEALIRNAHDHPILVVGPKVQSPSFEGPVAVALDGSKLAEAALLPALAWARAFGVQLQLLQVVPSTSDHTARAATDYLMSLQSIAEAGGVIAESCVISADDPVVGLVRHLSEHDCSLVAISSHSRDSVARLAFGSVTMGLIAESPCTVCAVHPDTSPPAALTGGVSADHAQLQRRSNDEP